MLSSNSWRTLCSLRALGCPRGPLINRKAGPTNVLFSVNTMNGVGYAGKDTWRNQTTHKALEKENQTSFSTNAVFPRNYCTGRVKMNCWKCKKPLENDPAFFCWACKVVQPPGEGTSYFKIMDCDYAFALDAHKLQRRYVQLQRLLHPDNFSQKSAEEQKHSEIQSALVNKAYKTLLKPLSRGLYMLELQGMRIEEGTDAEADPEFLMELMDTNEVLNEARTADEAEQIGRDVQGKLTELTKRIDAALLKDLATAKALLIRMKYYANIEEKVKEKLSTFM